MSEVSPNETAAPADTATQRRPKKLIKTQVTIHDRSQLETVFDYYTYRGKSSRRSRGFWSKIFRRSLAYDVDAYFLIPGSLGISAHTYTKDQFYQDLRPLIRFREPRIGFRQFLGEKPVGKSPLMKLSLYLTQLENGQKEIVGPESLAEVRLFGCSFIGYLLRQVSRRCQRIESVLAATTTDTPVIQKDGLSTKDADMEQYAIEDGDVSAEDLITSVSKAIESSRKAEQLLSEFRQLKIRLEALDSQVVGPFLEEFKKIDEYCSYRFSDGMVRMIKSIELVRQSKCLSVAEQVGMDTAACRQIALGERSYAKHQGYIVLDPSSSAELGERYLQRRSVLKKWVYQVLYLETRPRPTLSFRRQLGAMVAAGMAAAWAFAAQMMIVRQVVTADGMRDLYSVGGFFVLTAAIFAYVVKDRIKEFGRGFFGGGMLRNLPDNFDRILYPFEERFRTVGYLKETTRFVGDEGLPADVCETLKQENLMSDNFHEVIHYRKTVRLTRRALRVSGYPLRAVHDIIRFNMESFFSRMSDHFVDVEVLRDDGTLAKKTLPRTYRVGLVLRNSARDGMRRGVKQVDVQSFVLVLNKKGLVRVE